MKNTLTYFLLCLLLSPTVYAKKEQKPQPVADANVQFMENKGQITDQHGEVRRDIDVKIEANGVTMFVGDGEIHYQWFKSRESEVVSRESGASGPTPNPPKRGSIDNSPFELSEASHEQMRVTQEGKGDVEIYRMDVQLAGANKNAQVIFEDPTGYYENYYLAHTGEDGVSARGFQKVVYKDIYPNIDLVFYTSRVSGASVPPPPAGDIQNEFFPARGDIGVGSRGIKYDFIVHPGGNPADIKLRYEGATEVKLVDNTLVATTPFGTITEAAPYSYSKETGEEVVSAYRLSGNTLSFDVGSYMGTLVVDPILRWTTYYGGSKSDHGTAITSDINGHVYFGGHSNSMNNIATKGSHNITSSQNGKFDGFLAKFDDSGNRIWGIYFGGTEEERVYGITCDKDGNLYICGSSASDSAIATTGSHQDTLGDERVLSGVQYEDGFLLKFDSSGNRLWGTYYGGKNQDYISSVTCTKDGNIYLCGYTKSPNNMATAGSFQSNYYDFCGFIARFTSNGARIWGTYYGDSSSVVLRDIEIDNNGGIYVCGYALSPQSTNSLSSTGAHQVNPGGLSDGVIAKFNSLGQRIWGTFYGGAGYEDVHGMKCNSNGDLFVCGWTRSTSQIASANAADTSFGGLQDAFLLKFTTNGTRLWGTYYGGIGNDWGIDLCVLSGGNVFFAGFTASTSGLTLINAYKWSLATNYDLFLTEYTSNGVQLFGSYYGGADREFGFHDGVPGLRVNYSYTGLLSLISTTTSTSGVVLPSPHQSNYGGGSEDAFVLTFYTDTIVYVQQKFIDTTWCAGDTVYIPLDVSESFSFNNIFTVQLSNASGSFASPAIIGTKTSNDKDTIVCVVPLNTLPGTGYRIRIVSTAPAYVSQDNQWDIRIKPNPANFSLNHISNVCTGDTLHLSGSSTSTGVAWEWNGPNNFNSQTNDTFIANASFSDTGIYLLTANLDGCTLVDTTEVIVKPVPDKPTAGSNSPICETLPLTLTTGSTTTGVSYSWAGPGSYSSSTQNPTVTTSAGSTHAGDYISTATLNGCSSRDTTTVVVLPKPAKPTAAATNSPLCQRQDLQLTASTVTGAGYTWYGPLAFAANTQNPVRANVQLNHAGTYYVYATVSGCLSDTDSVVVIVNTDPFVNVFPTPGATICAGQQVIFTAVPTNGGTTSYNWLVNGISTGGTGTTYTTTTLNNGDAVSCAMTSTGTCATAFYDTSNAITMTVQPKLAPSVTISADAGPSLFPNEPINFTAAATDAGSAPKYQWKRNGTDIGGATGGIWGANANFLSDGDEICVLVTSSYTCPDPDTALSNCIKLEIRLSVGEIANDNNIKIYPNPVSGTLHIEGVEAGANIELIDVLGKSARGQLLTAQGTPPYAPFKGGIDVSGLVPGVYVVRVDGVVVGRVVKE